MPVFWYFSWISKPLTLFFRICADPNKRYGFFLLCTLRYSLSRFLAVLHYYWSCGIKEEKKPCDVIKQFGHIGDWFYHQKMPSKAFPSHTVMEKCSPQSNLADLTRRCDVKRLFNFLNLRWSQPLLLAFSTFICRKKTDYMVQFHHEHFAERIFVLPIKFEIWKHRM